ncbi:hypothetical protein N9W41_01555 [bacterium]|nr:hypothetical protein [bacterium]
MSTLNRFKKPGGFKQLLFLIESSNTAKKEQLLKVVANEDQTWAGHIQDRMLTIDKIFSFDGETLEKIISRIPGTTWVKALFHLEEGPRKELFDKITQFISHAQKVQLEADIAELDPPPDQVTAAHILIIKTARSLQEAGELPLEKLDDSLNIRTLDELVS